MNNRKLLVCLLMSLIFVFGLTGCNLAREDAVGQAPEFVGFFITSRTMGELRQEVRDLNQSRSNEDEGIQFMGILIEETKVDDLRYEYTSRRFDFGVPGFSLYARPYHEMVGDAVTTGMDLNEGFDVLLKEPSFHFTSQSITNELLVTLPITRLWWDENRTNDGVVFRMNRVFQLSDGSLRLVEEVGSVIPTPDPVMNQNVSRIGFAWETRSTVERQERTERFVLNMQLTAILDPVEYTMFHYDSNGNLIQSTTFTANQLPQEIRIHDETAFIVLSTYGSNFQGERVTNIESFTNHDAYMEVYRINKDGVGVLHQIPILW